MATNHHATKPNRPPGDTQANDCGRHGRHPHRTRGHGKAPAQARAFLFLHHRSHDRKTDRGRREAVSARQSASGSRCWLLSHRSFPGYDKSGSYVKKRIHEVTNRLIYFRFEKIHSRNLNEDYRYTECNPIGSDSHHRSCRRRSIK